MAKVDLIGGFETVTQQLPPPGIVERLGFPKKRVANAEIGTPRDYAIDVATNTTHREFELLTGVRVKITEIEPGKP